MRAESCSFPLLFIFSLWCWNQPLIESLSTTTTQSQAFQWFGSNHLKVEKGLGFQCGKNATEHLWEYLVVFFSDEKLWFLKVSLVTLPRLGSGKESSWWGHQVLFWVILFSVPHATVLPHIGKQYVSDLMGLFLLFCVVYDSPVAALSRTCGGTVNAELAFGLLSNH